MKRVQRRFGKLMKQGDDEQDVGAVLAEFKAADEMLDRVIMTQLSLNRTY